MRQVSRANDRTQNYVHYVKLYQVQDVSQTHLEVHHPSNNTIPVFIWLLTLATDPARVLLRLS